MRVGIVGVHWWPTTMMADVDGIGAAGRPMGERAA